MTTTAAHRFGGLEVLLGLAAIVVILALSALLQHQGLSQPYAMAAAMAAGLLAFLPAFRRWSNAAVPLYKWVVVVAAIVGISLALHLLLLRI